MQKTVQYLYLYFTKDDSDLLAWANMIKENNLGLSTWIQGILVAEAAKEKLYIGAVHIPTPQETVKRDNTQNLWGDDTESENHKILPGWHVRGQNRSLIAGSVLPVKITRPLAQEALFELKKRHKNCSICKSYYPPKPGDTAIRTKPCSKQNHCHRCICPL